MNRRRFLKTVLSVAVAIALPASRVLAVESKPQTEADIYVDTDSENPVMPYNSWHTATNDLAEALGMASSGDAVYVTGKVKFQESPSDVFVHFINADMTWGD